MPGEQTVRCDTICGPLMLPLASDELLHQFLAHHAECAWWRPEVVRYLLPEGSEGNAMGLTEDAPSRL